MHKGDIISYLFRYIYLLYGSWLHGSGAPLTARRGVDMSQGGWYVVRRCQAGRPGSSRQEEEGGQYQGTDRQVTVWGYMPNLVNTTHTTRHQCWCNVGPASQTLAQNYTTIKYPVFVKLHCWCNTGVPGCTRKRGGGYAKMAAPAQSSPLNITPQVPTCSFLFLDFLF